MKQLHVIKNEYSLGRMKKSTYIRRMYSIHSVLFEYAKFIKETDISELTIQDNSVIMTSRLSGARFLCAENDRRIAPIETINFGGYETEEFTIFRKLIHKKSVIFDIGANIGWYSLMLAKLLPSLQIYAFEPIPTKYSYLIKNIGINHVSNVHAYNFGFSDKKMKIPFYYYPEGSGNASAVNLSRSTHSKTFYCPVRTIDDFVLENKIKIDVIKCDVEGAELLVFQGGSQIIQRDKPIIFSEILRKWSKQFHYHPNEIISLLQSYGYTCFIEHNGKLRNFSAVDERTKESNFFFLHGMKHKKIMYQLMK